MTRRILRVAIISVILCSEISLCSTANSTVLATRSIQHEYRAINDQACNCVIDENLWSCIYESLQPMMGDDECLYRACSEFAIMDSVTYKKFDNSTLCVDGKKNNVAMYWASDREAWRVMSNRIWATLNSLIVLTTKPMGSSCKLQKVLKTQQPIDEKTCLSSDKNFQDPTDWLLVEENQLSLRVFAPKILGTDIVDGWIILQFSGDCHLRAPANDFSLNFYVTEVRLTNVSEDASSSFQIIKRKPTAAAALSTAIMLFISGLVFD